MTKNDSQKVGKVFLVGAGPGHPGLITIRGVDVLEHADAVVYDFLVPDEIVVTLPPHVERHYVGKQAGKHALPQEQISELLVKLAKEGKNVVRLKGGDPFVFGRGGEEAHELKSHGITFEIVPGVTSGIAAPAFAGIPATERMRSSTLILVTGHKAKCKDCSSVDWEALARIKNGTIVIYMGIGELEQIVETLLANGMSPVMPAAIIERGTFPSQVNVTAPLNQLVTAARENNITPPAIVVIGKVVELGADLDWVEHPPLFGKRILVTRPSDQAGFMYRELHHLGAEILPYPTIKTTESYDEKAWEKLDFDATDWIMLTSENGVRYFMDQFFRHYDDIRLLGGLHIAAIGAGTSRAMKLYHLAPDFVPQKATVKNLGREIVEEFDFKNARVIRVRGNLGDNSLEDALTAAGADVLPLSVYETTHARWSSEQIDKMIKHPPDIVTFTSGSTSDGLMENLTSDELRAAIMSARFVSIGPATSRILAGHGLKADIEATEHSVPGLIRAIVEDTEKGEE